MKSQRRKQTPKEETANAVSHGLALAATLAAVPVLIVSAAYRSSPGVLVGACVFSAALITVYVSSTLYHALPPGRGKQMARAMDHSAIYLLIAGTYTPFTLGVLRGGWGWTLFGLVWGLCLVGLVLESLPGRRRRVLAIGLYLVMGWLVLIAARPLWVNLPRAGFYWVLAGGLAYTGGVAFYAAHRVRYAHFLWHLCVMAGSACHYVAVLCYAA